MSSTPSNTVRLNSANGAARRIVANSSSTSQSSIDAIATICCATMSSGLRGIAGRFDGAVVHRLGDRGAGDEVAAELREDHALADRVGLMAAAADALQAARDRRRRLDLDDEIDGAHVDAELERRGGDERAQRAGLQQILDLDALRPRDRSVVRADERFAGQLVQRAGEPLGQAAAVDEDQRRAVRANQLEQPRVDRRPDRRPRVADRRRAARDLVGRRQPGHVLDRHLDRQLRAPSSGPASTMVTGR